MIIPIFFSGDPAKMFLEMTKKNVSDLPFTKWLTNFLYFIFYQIGALVIFRFQVASGFLVRESDSFPVSRY